MTRSVSRESGRRGSPAWWLVLIILLLTPGIGQGQDDPNAQHLVYVTTTLTGEARDIEIPVEVGVTRLELILDAGDGIRLTVFNPLGRLHPLSEPNVATTSSTGRRSVLIWDPRPGRWQVRLEGNGPLTLRAIVQGELFVCCGQIFTRNQVFAFERSRLVSGSLHQVQLFATGYNIESIDIRTVDAEGRPLAPVRFRQNDPSNLSSFVLLLEVPERPFRLRVEGRDLTGKPFQRVLPILITPVAAKDHSEEVDLPAVATPILVDLQRTTTTGPRPITRSRVVSWSDAPLLTPAGNQIGLRLRYRIRFPVTAVYSPQPYLYPERTGQGYTGALNLQVRRAVVSVLPASATPPASLNASAPEAGSQGDWIPGSRTTFFADTDYDFIVDLVPHYAQWQEKEGRFCVQSKPYLQTGLRERFERDISGRQRLRFRLMIGGSDLEGRGGTVTEQSYQPVSWLEGLKREGAAECPHQ